MIFLKYLHATLKITNKACAFKLIESQIAGMYVILQRKTRVIDSFFLEKFKVNSFFVFNLYEHYINLCFSKFKTVTSFDGGLIFYLKSGQPNVNKRYGQSCHVFLSCLCILLALSNM